MVDNSNQVLIEAKRIVEPKIEKKTEIVANNKPKFGTDLIAVYEIRLPNGGFHKDIRIEFAPTHIKVFGGCNFHTIKYHAYKDGEFQAQLDSSTRRSC